MIGLIDIEFNSGGPTGRVKNDMTMIEFTLQIVDDKDSYKVVELYDVVVRPHTGRTVLNSKIVELTTISQKEVDGGLDICTVYSDLRDLYAKYSLSDIYTWGTCDEEVIRWNYEKFDIEKLTGIQREEVCVHFTDLGAVLKERFEGRHVISLINMAVLCECKPVMQHRAFADVETMRNILISLLDTDTADMKSRFSAYDVYADLREMYNKMRNVVSIARDYDVDIDELLETAKLGSEFPVFDDAYNDTYNRRTFGWL